MDCEGRKLILREPNLRDFDFYYKLKCEYSSVYWSGFERPPHKETLQNHFMKFVNKEINDKDFYILEDREIPVGYLQLTHNNESEVEIGYGVSEDYRGHGYGYYLLSYAKSIISDMRGRVNLIGYVRDDNYSSKKCFVKNGFLRKEEYVKRYFALDKQSVKMFLYIWNKDIDQVM